MKKLILLGGFVLLSGCSFESGSRSIADILDPSCMPDGSIVYVQYVDKDNKFENLKASPANCAWNKGK